MTVPELIQNGQLTPEGEKTRDFIESLFEAADKSNNLSVLNSLGGYASHYYVNAYKGGGKGFGITPEQWFEDFQYTGAASAWHDMRRFEQQAEEAQQVAEAVDEVGNIAAELKKLQEALEEQKRQLAAVKGENTKLRKAVKELSEAEAEAETVDAEAEAETEDEPEEEAGEETTDESAEGEAEEADAEEV